MADEAHSLLVRQKRKRTPKGEAAAGPGTRAQPEKMTPCRREGASEESSKAAWKATMVPMEWPVGGEERGGHVLE
jgi:hypothetical protein